MATTHNRALYRDSEFHTREEEGGDMTIEGYFSVFDSTYDMGWGMSESIARGAFSNSLQQENADVRALVDHNTNLVLGRTTNHSLELREDDHGLWGKITINPKDTDAVNLYQRVKRGDVSGCSFGFNIVDEEAQYRDDGTIHWIIREVKLFEVSCCTFPAYEDTQISARSEDKHAIEKRRIEKRKAEIRKKLKGED